MPSAPVPLVLASLMALRRMLTGMMTANVKGTLAIAEAAATARTAYPPKTRLREQTARSRLSSGSLVREPQSTECSQGHLPCGGDRSSSRGGSLPGRESRTKRTRARRSCSAGPPSSPRLRASKSSRRGPAEDHARRLTRVSDRFRVNRIEKEG